MEPEDVKDSSLVKMGHTPSPAASQLNEDTSAGETTNSEGNLTIKDQQKVVKKEEPEDDGHLYGQISENNVTPFKQSDEEILKTVKEEEEEHEEDEYLGETSISVRRVVIVDESSEVFQNRSIKEEEPEDDDYLCKAEGVHKAAHAFS